MRSYNKDSTYMIKITFPNKKNLSKDRKEKFKSVLKDWEFSTITDGLFFSKDLNIICINQEYVIMMSKKLINNIEEILLILTILSIDRYSPDLAIEISLKNLVNRDEKEYDLIEQINDIKRLLKLNVTENKIINSIEFIDEIQKMMYFTSLRISNKGLNIKIYNYINKAEDTLSTFKVLQEVMTELINNVEMEE